MFNLTSRGFNVRRGILKYDHLLSGSIKVNLTKFQNQDVGAILADGDIVAERGRVISATFIVLIVSFISSVSLRKHGNTVEHSNIHFRVEKCQTENNEY